MNDKKVPEEPDWLFPSECRNTPYTEEELDQFTDGFIISNVEIFKSLVKDVGKTKAREIVKNGFRKMDERSVANMETDGQLH